MKRIVSIVIIALLALNISGCETMRKKFTRKKKTVKAPRIYQVKKYEKKPTPELYSKHYVFWSSWHSELIKVLGQNHKKDVQCIEQIISNLNDMANILIPEKGALLKTHIDKLEKVREMITKEDLGVGNKHYAIMTLEREERYIKREFSLSKMKDYLKKSFDDDAQNEPEKGS